MVRLSQLCRLSRMVLSDYGGSMTEVKNEEFVTVEVKLPYWIAVKADKLGIDLSEVLVKALKKELGIE